MRQAWSTRVALERFVCSFLYSSCFCLNSRALQVLLDLALANLLLLDCHLLLLDGLHPHAFQHSRVDLHRDRDRDRLRGLHWLRRGSGENAPAYRVAGLGAGIVVHVAAPFLPPVLQPILELGKLDFGRSGGREARGFIGHRYRRRHRHHTVRNWLGLRHWLGRCGGLGHVLRRLRRRGLLP